MTPPLAYLLFVRRQARILGRQAQRSGLYERARHYRHKEEEARQYLEIIYGLLIEGVHIV